MTILEASDGIVNSEGVRFIKIWKVLVIDLITCTYSCILSLYNLWSFPLVIWADFFLVSTLIHEMFAVDLASLHQWGGRGNFQGNSIHDICRSLQIFPHQGKHKIESIKPPWISNHVGSAFLLQSLQSLATRRDDDTFAVLLLETIFRTL